MSGNHFKKSVDPRLLVTDDLAYNVVSGAASITSQKTQATSVDITQEVFNVQVPSQKTCIDTNVEWNSTIVLEITATLSTAGTYVCNYGVSDALCPFPLNALLNTISNTINNATTTTNVKEIMPGLLRCFDRDELNKYQSTTPTALDSVYNYADQISSSSNVLAGYDKASLDRGFVPRGAFKLVSISSQPDSVVALDVGTATATVRKAYVTFVASEPLLFCSPWSYSRKADRPCLTGVTNMNFNMNFNNGARLWRWADIAGVTNKSCVVYSVRDAYLNFQMLTPHSSVPMPMRSVLPYYQLPRYSQTIAAPLAASGHGELVSTTMSLNSIPDTLIIFARDPSRISGAYADSFLKINGVNINWNNNNGLLTGYNSSQLFHTSSKNGLSQNFYEWNGAAHVGGVTNATGGGSDIITSGGVLVLKFGKDIQLNDTEAPGSLGNFQLQYTLSVGNQTLAAIPSVELVTIAVNSGLLITEAGVSSTNLGILTAADVIKVAEQPESYDYPARMLGDGIFDKLNSMVKSGRKVVGTVADVLSNPSVQSGLKKISGGKSRFM
jgi:hypothetical protein